MFCYQVPKQLDCAIWEPGSFCFGFCLFLFCVCVFGAGLEPRASRMLACTEPWSYICSPETQFFFMFPEYNRNISEYFQCVKIAKDG